MLPLTYPARPLNGGKLESAPPKLGAFYYEPKVDDHRALAYLGGNTPIVWNRHGALLSNPEDYTAAWEALSEIAATTDIVWWDCGVLGRRSPVGRGCVVVFDWVPTAAGVADPGRPFHPPWYSRNQFMHQYIPEFDLVFQPDRFPLLSIPPLCCKEVWRDLPPINKDLGCPFYEGVVAKRHDSPYPVQLADPDLAFHGWIKHRFL